MPALALASFLLSLSIKVRLDYQKDKDTGNRLVLLSHLIYCF